MKALRRTGASGLMTIAAITVVALILPLSPLLLAQYRPPTALAKPQGSSFRQPKHKYREGELLVKYRPEAIQRRDSSLSAHGASIVRTLTDESFVHIRLPAGRTVADSLAEYEGDPDIELAQPNYYQHVLGQNLPDTTDLPNLWGFRNTKQTIGPTISLGSGGAIIPQDSPEGWVYSTNNGTESTAFDIAMEDAWLITTNCSSVIVAVIDTGVNYNSTNLTANMWTPGVGTATNCGNGGAPIHGCDFVETDTNPHGTNNPMDQHGHGTHVSGTIGAVGSISSLNGHTGVCWSAQIMAVRVLDSEGYGTDSDIIAGMDYALTNGAKVLNMSLGGPGIDSAYGIEIEKATNLGALIVVAAGNDGTDNDLSPDTPCNFSTTNLNVLCVAALDQGGQLATFSNFGKDSVQVGAPGVNIVSDYPGQVYPYSDNFSGQSCGGTWTCGAAAGTTGAGWSFDEGVEASDRPENPNTNDWAWTTYNTSDSNFSTSSISSEALSFAASGVITKMQLSAFTQIGPADAFNVYVSNVPGDPNPLSADPLATNTGLLVFQNVGDAGSTFQETDISTTVQGSTTLSVGIQLASAPSGSTGGTGVAVGPLTLTQLVQDTSPNNHYNILNGTSQATPHVAGLATMLFAFNPNMNFRNVYNAIIQGGVALPALTQNTLSGNGINAFYSLLYISAPTNIFGSTP